MKRLCLVAAIVACVGAGRAEASTIFADNFNSENGGVGALNYNAFTNFTITNGTVDLIGNGFFDFLPGNGLYVDLDGSTSDAGLMTDHAIALPAGNYNLQFDLAGSQRGSLESVRVNVFGGLNPSYAAQSYSLASADPFLTRTIPFTLGAGDGIQFSFQNAGGDNVGALLDNIALTTNGGQQPVPEPTSLLLLGTGLVGAARRWRRVH